MLILDNKKQVIFMRNNEFPHTRERPGEGLESALTITVS